MMGYLSNRKQIKANRERSRLKEENYTDGKQKSLLRRIWDWIK